MHQSGPIRFEFRRFHVLPDNRELLADGAPVRIGAKAFDLLLALLDTPGLIIPRDQLIKRVWNVAYIESNCLDAQVRALRNALGDDKDVVATFPGRGYRFTADVRTVHRPLAPREPSPLPFALPLSSFLGRDGDRDAVVALLHRHRLVTLIGSGGIGKTRLALEVVRTKTPHFADGVAFAELANVRDPSLLSCAIGRAFGLIVEDEVRLIAALRPLAALLVLDNCEHQVDALSALLQRIASAAPKLRVLSTSQQALRVEGEWLYRVHPLGVTPERGDPEGRESAAFRLFTERVQSAAPSVQLQASQFPLIRSVCERLEGIPLAIELAAARAATLGLHDVSAGLDSRLTLTSQSHERPERHRSLLAMLDWSHSLLSPQERSTLRRLSVFRGDFSVEAANVVAGDAQEDCRGRLAALVDKSLLVPVGRESGRFRLLETTRQYAAERLAEADEVELASSRHAAFYRRLMVEATTPWQQAAQPGWVETYEAELHQIRGALDWHFASGGSGPDCIDLVLAAVPLWTQLSIYAECEGYLRLALRQHDAGQLSKSKRMELLAALSMVIVPTAVAAPEKAEIAREALQLATELDDLEFQSRILVSLYRSECWSVDGGRLNSRAFLSLARRRKAEGDILWGSSVVGKELMVGGEIERALQLVEPIAMSPPQPWDRARSFRFGADVRLFAMANYGLLLWLRGEAVEAALAADRAIEQAHLADQPLTQFYACATAAVVALLEEDVAASRRYAGMLEALAEHLDEGLGRIDAQLIVAAVDLFAGGAPDVDTMARALGCRHQVWIGHFLPLYWAWYAQASSAACLHRSALRQIERASEACAVAAWCEPEIERIRAGISAVAGQADPDARVGRAIRRAANLGAMAWSRRPGPDGVSPVWNGSATAADRPRISDRFQTAWEGSAVASAS